MPRDNNGNWTSPVTLAPNTTARATDVMSAVDDLGAEISDSLSRTGKGSMLAPLEMGSNKIVDVAPGTVPTDAATLAQVPDAIPPGAVMHFARATAPTGWLKANGAAVSRTTYAALFAALGTTFGVGDGSTTFNLPDLRGEFLRGLDDARGVDTGRTLGTAQANAVQAHTHPIADPGHTHPVSDPGHLHPFTSLNGVGVSAGGVASASGTPVTNNTSTSLTGISVGTSLSNVSVQSAGGPETRPRNIALLACIKA